MKKILTLPNITSILLQYITYFWVMLTISLLFVVFILSMFYIFPICDTFILFLKLKRFFEKKCVFYSISYVLFLNFYNFVFLFSILFLKFTIQNQLSLTFTSRSNPLSLRSIKLCRFFLLYTSLIRINFSLNAS